MRRTILASLVAIAAVSFTPGLVGAASAAQSGLTGDPWIDQYIEQIPTAEGGKVNDRGGKPRSGLGSGQISNLATAGGDNFAYAVAAMVLPANKATKDGKTSGPAVGTAEYVNQIERKAAAPSTTSSIIASLGGGDGGLGAILPIALIGGLIGGIALAASRFRRSGD